MFKIRSNSQIELSKNSSDEIVKKLEVLPKNCNCGICEATKVEAKEKLGKRDYNSLVNHYNIIV